MRAHLDGRVGVGGVVLSDQADGEAAPQAGGHAEEQVVVLDDALGLVGEDAVKLAGQAQQGDGQDCLQQGEVSLRVALEAEWPWAAGVAASDGANSD